MHFIYSYLSFTALKMAAAVSSYTKENTKAHKT